MSYNDIRRVSKCVKIKDKSIGGSSDILIQSMTNTDTENAEETINQIKALESVGCDIVRITVPTLSSVETVRQIKKTDIKIPIVADIHFDYKIALECVKAGIDKIRINPGNIGEEWKIKEVADACRNAGPPLPRRWRRALFITLSFLKNSDLTI